MTGIKTLRNEVTNAIQDALQSYYLGIIDENRENPKRMWKAVNVANNYWPVSVIAIFSRI